MPSVGLRAGLCRASGYFRGLLYSQVSAPRDRRFLPTPSLAVTVAASGWLWVRLRLSRSALEPFLLRGAAGPGWGWETAPASWPGRWSRCLRPGAGLAGSLPPVVPPPPASAPPRRPASRRLSPCRTPPPPPTDAAATRRCPRAPGDHAAALARDTAGCAGRPGARE